MQVHIATIVNEPENAPTVVIAKSKPELFQQLMEHDELSHLDLNGCTTCDDICERFTDASEDDMDGNMYAGLFIEVQDL